MTTLKGLAAFALLGSVSAFSMPMADSSEQAPLVDTSPPTQALAGYATKSLVDSEALQNTISGDNLLARARQLYKIAELSFDEFNHPTRVIGSEGTSLSGLHEHPTCSPSLLDPHADHSKQAMQRHFNTSSRNSPS